MFKVPLMVSIFELNLDYFISFAVRAPMEFPDVAFPPAERKVVLWHFFLNGSVAMSKGS